jgi:hypothetical protein
MVFSIHLKITIVGIIELKQNCNKMTTEAFLKIFAHSAQSEVDIISEVNVYNKLVSTVTILTSYK